MRLMRLMKKLTSAIVIAALMLCMSFPPRPSEGSWRTVGWMTALLGEVSALMALQTNIIVMRERILDNIKDSQTIGIYEQQFDTAMYAHDHRALASSQRIDPTGISSTLSTLYSDLTRAGGVSFGGSLADGNLDNFLTGGPSASPADFHGDYRRRAESLRDYSVGVMNGNDSEMRRLVRYQNEAFVPMLNALFAGDSQSSLRNIWRDEHNKMQKFHNWMLPYNAANPNSFKDAEGEEFFGRNNQAILTGPGYRRTIQASGQIANLKNHLTTGVMASLARQLEADVKYAHNEQQEKADAHFAFGRAVGSWHPVNGNSY